MNKRFLFYTIVLLVVIALGAVIITSATETPPAKETGAAKRGEVISEAETSEKKKFCLCCADRIERLKEKVRQAHERKRATEQAEKPTTSNSGK